MCLLGAKKLGANVLLVDPNGLAYGASGRNAGFLTCGSLQFFKSNCEKYGVQKALELWQFCQANHDLLVEQLDLFSAHYKKTGSLSTNINWNPNGPEKKALVDAGFSSAIVTHGPFSGYLYPGDGAIDPVGLVGLIYSKVNCPIAASVPTLSSGQIVIDATNGYTELPNITPTRAQCLLTHPVDIEIKPNIYVCDKKIYLRQDHQKRILCGGLRHMDEETETGTDDLLNPRILNALALWLQEVLGAQLSQPIKIQNQWSGVMGFTESQLPMIEVTSKFSLFIGGYSGHGMGMAFHLSKKLIESIERGQLESFNFVDTR